MADRRNGAKLAGRLDGCNTEGAAVWGILFVLLMGLIHVESAARLP